MFLLMLQMDASHPGSRLAVLSLLTQLTCKGCAQRFRIIASPSIAVMPAQKGDVQCRVMYYSTAVLDFIPRMTVCHSGRLAVRRCCLRFCFAAMMLQALGHGEERHPVLSLCPPLPLLGGCARGGSRSSAAQVDQAHGGCARMAGVCCGGDHTPTPGRVR